MIVPCRKRAYTVPALIPQDPLDIFPVGLSCIQGHHHRPDADLCSEILLKIRQQLQCAMGRCGIHSVPEKGNSRVGTERTRDNRRSSESSTLLSFTFLSFSFRTICGTQIPICRLQMLIFACRCAIFGMHFQTFGSFIIQKPVIRYDRSHPPPLDRDEESPLYASTRQDTVPIKQPLIKEPDL